jgi:signal transduction histidine kinase
VDAVRHGAQDYLVKGQTHERLLLRSVYYAIERKRAEEELEARVRERTAQLAEANRALQAEFAEHKRLQNEVLEVSEREQRRIGQDLHDVLGQNLTAIMFVVDALEERLASKSLPEADDAAKAIKLLDQAVAQARSLARGLCPVRLEADGLMAALEEFASNIAANFGIPCSFECRSPVLVRDSAVAIHLFRIAQEAVHNAIKHAKPSQIAIRLRESGGRITLAVQDDGGGIPREAGTRKGLGLQIMNYRASLLGGALSIQPPPGGGTLVTCSVPSERAAGQERTAPHSQS